MRFYLATLVLGRVWYMVVFGYRGWLGGGIGCRGGMGKMV